MSLVLLAGAAAAVVGAALPPAYRGTWASEPSACARVSSPDRVAVTATRFRDARVVRVYPRGPGSELAMLRIPGGATVERQLLLEDRGRTLRVVEELGIMNYSKCGSAR